MAELRWKPARLPAREPIEGDAARLEPLDARRHARQLYAAVAGADELWRFLPYGPFPDEQAFTAWIAECAASADPLFYAIVDRTSGEPRGVGSYLRMVPQHGVIEIGHLLFSPLMQRTRLATEAIYLWSRHAFDDLGYRRLEWKCNAQNVPSRRAAERFGFTYEGVFRQHMVVKDRNRNTAWYSITDREWPLRRAADEAWLSPDNFDADGRHRRSLAEVREGIQPAPG
ncbi:MAG TPA: GNAT family protein [Candidatus Dormibacteraeota bacterium]|nr:GNAT family protein [Candidatus Dormibacteraeota bacterium]